MTFESLGLSAELLRAIAAQGYTHPTPVQRDAIPAILQGRDVLAGAQTGTGKTAAFALPLLQRLAATPRPSGSRGVRALVLTPTRELAAQVGDGVEAYGRHLALKSAVVFGGVSVQRQIGQLRAGTDVLVATPGRLLDHVEQGTVDLSGVEILVLDEADRMLDMGFIRDIRRVIARLPKRRQNLLFSATYAKPIRQLAETLLRDPVHVAVAPEKRTAEGIEQLVHPVDKARKRELLAHLVGAHDWQQVLVFMRTKHGANRLTQQLERDGITAAAIHGNKSQAARTRALDDFKRGRVRVLVATDIAARGLDIDQLPQVVNFELPQVPEDYVHRIGRTGRAGRAGRALSLVSADERSLLDGVEKLLGASVPRETVPGFEPDPSARDAQTPPPAARRNPRDAAVSRGPRNPRNPRNPRGSGFGTPARAERSRGGRGAGRLSG